MDAQGLLGEYVYKSRQCTNKLERYFVISARLFILKNRSTPLMGPLF